MKTNYFINYHSWALVLLSVLYLMITYILQQYDFTYTVLVLVGFLALVKSIDLYWWKYRAFLWLLKIENFSGTYTGKQHCYVIQQQQNDEKKPILIDVWIVIKQTASTVHVHAFYKNDGKKSSSSYNESCILAKTNDDTHYQLTYYYFNTGSALLDQHNGTSITKITKKEGEYFLNGHYYTNRQPYPTRGNFYDLKRITKETTHPF